jgi:hypothetical protein
MITRALDAPLESISAYELVLPTGRPRFIQSLCFELIDEAYCRGADVPSRAVFAAEILASGHEAYAQIFARMMETLERAERVS